MSESRKEIDNDRIPLMQNTMNSYSNHDRFSYGSGAREDNHGISKSESDNEKKEAERLNKILQPIHHSMFVESNPSPVKYASKLLGLCDDNVRLPLVKVTDQTKEIVRQALQSAKLIKWLKKPMLVWRSFV